MTGKTYKEVIQECIEQGYKGTDNTCNGKCTKCGECCGEVLPLDQEDVDKIQEYVFKNGILPQRHMLIMRMKLQCPYYRGGEKGCAIYEARPKICRYYKCDKNYMLPKELKTMGKTYPIDMWALATAIEKEMKKNAINKKAGKAANKSI